MQARRLTGLTGRDIISTFEVVEVGEVWYLSLGEPQRHGDADHAGQ